MVQRCRKDSQIFRYSFSVHLVCIGFTTYKNGQLCHFISVMSYVYKYKKLREIGMANHECNKKLPSAVVVYVSPSPPISFFHVSMTLLGQK